MSLLEDLVSLISPASCVGCSQEGSVICPTCIPVILKPFGERCYMCARLSQAGKTCPKCTRFGGPAHLWINALHEGSAERLIRQYKFQSQRSVGRAVAQIMYQNLTNYSLPIDSLIVPVPTATKRIRERGFDHSTHLAKLIARRSNLEYASIVGRSGQSRQVGASRLKRLAQAQSNYWVTNPKRVTGRNILLIDDVVTTGATIQAVTKVLRQAGALRINALVFAKRQ